MNTTRNLFILLTMALLLAPPALEGQTAAGRILTGQQIKNYWLNTFPQPNSLDRDYHQKKREYARLVETIRSGALDDEATMAALENNLAVHTAAGDAANAQATRQDITRLQASIAEKKRLAELRRMTGELESIRITLQMLDTARLRRFAE